MGRVEKTVFISYRRTNLPWALAIYQNLTAHGCDVFFDYESLSSGDFEQSILSNIRARAHFLVVLTPSALERCVNPDDWLRREIETALDEKRNIVLLFLEGFNFGSPSISNQLTGKLEKLKNYNGLNIPADFFNEAMERLISRHLDVTLDAVLHPVSTTVQQEVQKQQATASEAAKVKEKELSAQEWFEKANKYWLEKNYDETIYCATEAIRLKLDFVDAYSRRGTARDALGDFNGALKDYDEAISINPDFAFAYNNRGSVFAQYGNLDKAIQDFTLSIELNNSELYKPYTNRGLALQKKGDIDNAIKDYTEAIRIKPDYVDAYYSRGDACQSKGDLDGAIRDFTKAISLKSDFAEAYASRANVRQHKGDLDGAIRDYTEAIQLRPDFVEAYNNRGVALQSKEDLDGAIRDYTEVIRLKPNTTTYYSRGLAHQSKGDLDSAIKDFTEAIRLSPDYAEAYASRGHTRQGNGDLDGAIRDFTEAVRIKPDYVEVYYNRGVTRYNKPSAHV